MPLCNWENLSPKAPPKRRILCAHHLHGHRQITTEVPKPNNAIGTLLTRTPSSYFSS